MAVNELSLTVVGWVGNEPTLYLGEDGQVPFTKFRLGSTPRLYDREQDAYVDAATSWFTVKAFRHLAQNVAASIRRGDPVVVTGRVRLVDWVAPDGHTRTTAELTADTVGHDLTRGTTRFARTVHEQRGGPGDASGGAADRTDGEHAGAVARGAGPVDVSGAVVLDDETADDPRAAPAPA
ncbi:MAG: single-stranded DNA-binding protein [Micrococcales bacterium]|uniref:single-stranded DNA-binding protein n=1 Tax=Cellulomonas sp. P4 TaxID=3142533 RepID=UPI0019B0F05E|nr:single-stranded DNA-binding protein [Micrococcales bacterium]